MRLDDDFDEEATPWPAMLAGGAAVTAGIMLALAIAQTQF